MPKLKDQPWPPNALPKVGVFCATYNQAPFIRDAIEGFLCQETDFPVEVIIHDDASTDGTSSIVAEYAKRYPTVIKAVLQEKNQVSQGISPRRSVKDLLRGDYIAYCEGDDYWSSSDKLQLQVNALNARPEASACFHPADGLFEGAAPALVKRFFAPDVEKSEYSTDDLLIGDNFIPTASVVIRGDLVRQLFEMDIRIPHGDHFSWVYASLHGPVVYLPCSMSVYRKHQGGIHSGMPYAIQALNSLVTLYGMARHLGIEKSPALESGFQRRAAQIRKSITEYEERARSLEQEIAHLEQTISIFRKSRVLRSWNRVKDFLAYSNARG